MKQAEIARRFDEIVAFAGVDRFVDTPVKHYSTGMYLRLAFAVAAHLDPEILMVDEVLAVGDAAFQRKCLGKMQEVGDSGRTVLFVSHDMTAIMRLSSRSIVLEDGRVRYIGPTADAIRLYTEQPVRVDEIASRRDRAGDGSLRVQAIRFRDEQHRYVATIGSCKPVTIEMWFRADRAGLNPDDLRLHVRLTDMLGQPVTTFATRFHPIVDGPRLAAEGVIVCHVPSLALAADTYAVDFWVDHRGNLADRVIRAGEIHVAPSDHFVAGSAPIRWWNGAAIMPHSWAVGDDRSLEAADADTALAVVGGSRP
jgi:lipopolysaccharide transport system ATP-binding protein